jgi:hypothetical protein
LSWNIPRWLGRGNIPSRPFIRSRHRAFSGIRPVPEPLGVGVDRSGDHLVTSAETSSSKAPCGAFAECSACLSPVPHRCSAADTPQSRHRRLHSGLSRLALLGDMSRPPRVKSSAGALGDAPLQRIGARRSPYVPVFDRRASLCLQEAASAIGPGLRFANRDSRNRHKCRPG